MLTFKRLYGFEVKPSLTAFGIGSQGDEIGKQISGLGHTNPLQFCLSGIYLLNNS